MDNIFPSLSTAGFVADRTIIVKKLLQMFVDSDENQSNYYKVSSYKYIVNNNPAGYETANELKKVLIILYSYYFDTVSVDVTYEYIELLSLYEYSISITGVYKTISYKLEEKIANGILKGE